LSLKEERKSLEKDEEREKFIEGATF
jgi:hypothetical protein